MHQVDPKCSPCDELEIALNNSHHSHQMQSKTKQQMGKRILSKDDCDCLDLMNGLMEVVSLSNGAIYMNNNVIQQDNYQACFKIIINYFLNSSSSYYLQRYLPTMICINHRDPFLLIRE